MTGKPKSDRRRPPHSPSGSRQRTGPRPDQRQGGRPDNRRDPRPAGDPSIVWLYGRHAVAAALANPQRKILRGFVTKNAADWLIESASRPNASPPLKMRAPMRSTGCCTPVAVHQGIAVEARDLTARVERRLRS